MAKACYIEQAVQKVRRIVGAKTWEEEKKSGWST